uniref:HRDC domain-containing protein n=1 Tax=Sandarakinorhabdus rubra TaxID=2672568 RepID=UPI00196A1538
WPADQWRALARQLEAMDALERDPEHGGLILGPAARPILKGEVAISLKRAPLRSRQGRSDRAERSASAGLDAADTPLFEALRALRRTLAAEAGVPPYVVFHDSTLRAMAANRPDSLAALGRVPGVGAAKLERWGPAFLSAITSATAAA